MKISQTYIILFEANEHSKVVQEALGHSDITLTLNIYSHIIPEIRRAAVQKPNYLFDNNIMLKNNVEN